MYYILISCFSELKIESGCRTQRGDDNEFEPQGNTHPFRQWTSARIPERERHIVWTCTVPLYGK